MTIYFGRPGAQISIPDPRNSLESTRVRSTAVFLTGSGGARGGRLLEGKRQFTLNWQQLWYSTYATLEGYHHGHEGPGPFVLHDPGRINLLTVNQSSATSHRNDTDGFSVTASGHSIASSSSSVNRGPRALEWNLTYAVTGNLYVLPATPIWPGIPTLAGQSMCFWMQAVGNGVTDPTVNLAAKLAWLDSTGVVLSTTTGSTLGTNGAAYQQLSVAGTPPASALYVLPYIQISGALAGASVHLDNIQLEMAAAPTTWRPGTGLWPVQVVSLTEKWPWAASDYRQNPTLVLQEVGP